MPELPEVETVVSTLAYQLKDVTIQSCVVKWKNIIAFPDVDAFCCQMINRKICNFGRIGKFIMLDLFDKVLFVHLRMEGKFYIMNDCKSIDKHTHVIFELNDGRFLQYHDTRKFGKMYLYTKREDQKYPCLNHIGYDIFDSCLTAEYLYKKLHSRQKCLKAILLEQSVFAGVGNIYADEICFAMKLHPQTEIAHFSKKDFEKLLKEMRRILKVAIACGGTTIRSYTSSLGVDGRFQLKLNVHAKKGEACPKCKHIIIKKVVVGRGTYYCPACQKKM